MFNKQNLFSKPGDSTQERRPTYPNSLAQRSPQPSSSASPSSAASPAQTETPQANEIAVDTKETVSIDTTRNPAEVTGSQLIVGPDVKLKGAEILDCDTLVVEGRVEATMDSRVIRIAERGSFAGKVGIDVAEVHGHFEGELTARKQLVIHATGRVSGVIRYGKILIEEGGMVCGDVQSLESGESARIARIQPLVVPAKG